MEKLLDKEVSRRHLVTYNDEVDGIYETQSIQSQTNGADYAASDNLVTATIRDSVTDDILSSKNPDGTMSFYAYSYSTSPNQKTTTVTTGQPDTGNPPTQIIEGTQTVTVVGEFGEIISKEVWNITGGTADVMLESETYSYSDTLKRSFTVTYLDGTQRTVIYDCCGLNSETDRDGITTTNYYDALQRQTAFSRLGIKTTNVLDAAGNVLATIRIGTNGTNQIVLRQAAYDLAGQTVTETNAINGVTTYTNLIGAYGETIKTNTYPDGGTRIETYFQDGTLANVTGTAVSPVGYDYGVEQVGTPWRAYTKEIKLDASLPPPSNGQRATATWSVAPSKPFMPVRSARPTASLSITTWGNSGKPSIPIR